MTADNARREGHRGKFLVAFAAIAIAGASCIGIALASQHHAPQPPAATAQAPLPPPPVALPAVTTPAPSASAGVVTPSPTGVVLPRSVPTAIAIPALGIHAAFVQLGLNSDGTIQVPDDVTHVGWYTLGPSPGQLGPAIVLGHVDSAASGAGVFFKLGAVKTGDGIDITLADGRAVSFSIYAVREYSKDDFPTDLVYGNTTGPELRLITCGGRFDKATGHYLSNIVVFARMTD